MKSSLLFGLSLCLFLASCSSDDDGVSGYVPELPMPKRMLFDSVVVHDIPLKNDFGGAWDVFSFYPELYWVLSTESQELVVTDIVESAEALTTYTFGMNWTIDSMDLEHVLEAVDDDYGHREIMTSYTFIPSEFYTEHNGATEVHFPNPERFEFDFTFYVRYEF